MAQSTTGRQIAAARALLGMSQADLAIKSSISVPTLKRMEASAGAASGLTNNVRAVCSALEVAGIIFQDAGSLVGGGPGVRLSRVPADPADLDRKINEFEEHLAGTDLNAPPSPEAGMERLENARKQNVVTKLKNKRATLKDKG
jgi:transcriptional regulator with XRE-family HTH domain